VTTIRLREYERREGLTVSRSTAGVLRTVFNATVQSSISDPDSVDIVASSIVGAVSTGDDLVIVEPKIRISQVLFLLAYTADPGAWREDTVHLGEYPDLTSGVTALFVELTERALMRGVLHGYHEVAADGVAVRGRLDLQEQVRARPGLNLPLALRFTEYDGDIVENRLLLAAGLLLRGLPGYDPTTARRLHRVLSTLAAEANPIPVHPAHVPTVNWTRLNNHYRPAVELARLLLSRETPHLDAGGLSALGLTLDLWSLFEDFVRVALREAIGASEQDFPAGAACPPLSLDAAGRVRLQPDLSWWIGGRCRFIGDVKYKRDSASGHNPDLYQLYAYSTAARLSNAMLIYADGSPGPVRHVVPPLDVELSVEHLDLSQPPAAILGSVGRLGARIVAQSGTPMLSAVS
jgi:5-methylcytosine-specific restriction enzyme subunit McrC